MKVVINSCYGRFGLSPLAVAEYLKRKGKCCYFYDDGFSGKYKRIDIDRAVENRIFTTTVKDVGKNPTWKDIEPYRFYYGYIERTDKDLIAVIEELGEKADGNCAKLSIVEIPDGIEWEISEYDGIETVEEKHGKWN